MNPIDSKTEVKGILADLSNPKKYVDVNTAKEYFALPFSKRTRETWWGDYYLLPHALKMNDGELDGDPPLCSEWDTFYKQIKKDFPVQSFFRVTVDDWFDTIKRRVERRYYDTRDWLFPRQRWLLKGLPNHWQDKRSLSVDALFKMIVHFVEVEDALNVIDWDSDSEHLTFKQGLVECYRWIKFGRPELLKQIDIELMENVEWRRLLYKTIGHNIEGYNAVYGPYDQLEKQLDDTDTEMCIWIIRNRAYLWT